MFGKVTKSFLAAFIVWYAFALPVQAADDMEKRVMALEEQLRKQNEQNELMLKLLQSMAAQGTPPAPAPAKEPVEANNAPAAGPAAPVKVNLDQYTPGWIARIYSIDKGFDVTGALPKSEIGRFVANKSAYSLADYQDSIPISLSGKSVLWKCEAYLQVNEPGNHVFALNLRRLAFGIIYIEGTEIGRGHDAACIGTAELEPGLYKVDVVIAGMTDSSGKARGYFCGGAGCALFEMAVKRPSDDVPLPASEVFLVKKSSK